MAVEAIEPGGASLDANAAPAPTEGTASVKPIGVAKKATAAEPEALEPRAEGEVWHGLDMPLPPSQEDSGEPRPPPREALTKREGRARGRQGKQRDGHGSVVAPWCGTIDDDQKEVGGSGGHGGRRRRHSMSFELKWKCGKQGSTGSAWLGLCRLLALCPLSLLALEGRTLLMQFTRPVTLARRRLVWLEDLRVGEVGEPLGAAAAADTARRWGLEAGVLDDVGVAVSIVVALVAPDATTTSRRLPMWTPTPPRWRRTRRRGMTQRSSRCGRSAPS